MVLVLLAIDCSDSDCDCIVYRKTEIMTYKIVIQVGEKKVVIDVESDEELNSKDVYVDKVLRRKDKPNPKSDSASLNFLKKMFGI